MLRAGEIPNFFYNSHVNFAINWGPRSETILVSRPCHINTLSWKSVMVSSTVIVFLHRIIMIPLDNPWLTTTLIELYPLLSGRSVTELVEMKHQGIFVVSNS